MLIVLHTIAIQTLYLWVILFPCRIYLTNVKLLPLALCGDVYEGDETDHEPEKESQSPQNLLSVTIAFIYTVAIASYIIV